MYNTLCSDQTAALIRGRGPALHFRRRLRLRYMPHGHDSRHMGRPTDVRWRDNGRSTIEDATIRRSRSRGGWLSTVSREASRSPAKGWFTPFAHGDDEVVAEEKFKAQGAIPHRSDPSDASDGTREETLFRVAVSALSLGESKAQSRYAFHLLPPFHLLPAFNPAMALLPSRSSAAHGSWGSNVTFPLSASYRS